MTGVRFILFSSVCLSLMHASANGGQGADDLDYPRVPQCVILSITGTHYHGIAQALSCVGFHVREVSAAQYLSSDRAGDTLLIVPSQEGWQLDSTFVMTILHQVESGKPLLCEGATPLAVKLGLDFTGARGSMTKYRWKRYAGELIRLPGRLTFPRCKGNPSLRALADEPQTREPLVVLGNLGEGRFIYSALPLEPPKGMVYEYLPFLAQVIVDEFHMTPSLTADNLSVYLDWGDNPNYNPAILAMRLKGWGVREVHLGAWYDSQSFRHFTRRFIHAAHLQGIVVFAWLEFPMVSEDFWKQHPEWREVTASGRPAIVDWRCHMALEDPNCLRAVLDRTRRQVMGFDWDGIDLAELYFEPSPSGFEDPAHFTPMHPVFRRMFQQRHGVDPVEIFKPHSPYYWRRSEKMHRALSEFRIKLITRLTETFLMNIARWKERKPYLQTTLTYIDPLYEPSMKERIGVDPDRLLALLKKYTFTVEVEDPFTVWNAGPDRYRVIGRHYRTRLHPDTPFTIDINIVDRDEPVRPLLRQRGLELYTLIEAVASNTDMVTLYGVSSFVADDMRLVPFVLGAQQGMCDVTDRVTVHARRQIYWRTDTRGRTAHVDGREWPCLSDSYVLVPAGAHAVYTRPQPDNAEPGALRIERVSGRIIEASRSGKQVTMTYQSPGRCFVTLSRKPTALLCDGAPFRGKSVRDGRKVFLALPSGKHTVVVE